MGMEGRVIGHFRSWVMGCREGEMGFGGGRAGCHRDSMAMAMGFSGLRGRCYYWYELIGRSL